MFPFLRPSSLQRLLQSLDRTDFTFSKNNPQWQVLDYSQGTQILPFFLKVELELHVDGGGGEAGDEVVRMANNWIFKHGKKVQS